MGVLYNKDLLISGIGTTVSKGYRGSAQQLCLYARFRTPNEFGATQAYSV